MAGNGTPAVGGVQKVWPDTVLNAQSAAAKAIELDDSLADGHAAMAYLNFMWVWDWAKAECEFRRAIELNPNYVPAHHWFALYLAAMGRGQEAIREIKLARDLDPLSPIVNTAVGYVLFFNRDYDEANRACTSVLDRNPHFTVAHFVLGRMYDAKGMHSQAIAELEQAVQVSDQPAYLSALGHAYARAGRSADAKRILDK